MKKIFIAIVALAAATACSNSEIVSVNREAIAFDNAFVNNSTRSVVDPSFTNTADGIFEDFAVYGFVSADNQTPAAIFNGTQVVGPDWTYDGTQYWIKDATYNFYAVAPKTDGNWTCANGNANNSGLTLAVYNWDGTQDVLFAQAKNIRGKASGENDPVEFNFQHILSKVKFSFTNNYDATNSAIRVKNIMINNAYKMGYVFLGTSDNDPTWTPNQNNADTELEFGNAAVASATADEAFAKGATVESYNELLLIPGAVNGGYNVTFNVEVLVNSVVVKTYNHSVNVDFTPAAGCSYDIAATINAENINPAEALDPIEFTVNKVIDWDKDHDGKENTAEGDTDGDNQVDTVIP